MKNLKVKENERHFHSGRHKTARTSVKVGAVRDSVAASPKNSAQRRRQELGISRESVRTIKVKDHNSYAYKIQISQKLIAEDLRK